VLIVAPSGFVDLDGSHRQPLKGASRVADAPADEEVLLTLVLRRRTGAELPSDAASTTSRAQGRERLAQAAGADPQDVERVEQFVRDSGMDVVSSDGAARSIVVRGSVEQANSLFDVSLGQYEAEGLSYRGREGVVRLPADVAEAVEAVLGLDDRPQARMRLKRGPTLGDADLPDPESDPASLLPEVERVAAARAQPQLQPQPLWAHQVARLYDFPRELDGSGQTIAIIELGGGYRDDELAAYFEKAGVPAPEVIAVPVDKGTNSPGEDADGEVLLDIEVAGTVAPAARLVVYFADNSDRGFFDAINRAVHDTTYAPSAVSISWGGPESTWTPQAMTAFDGALADAGALGVTVLAAAGDHGAADAAGDGQVHADFPASSPHIVACGGTEIVGLHDTAVSEVTWNEGDGWATGGGVSAQFPVPEWQIDVGIPENLNGSNQPGRGVPDVAGNASGRSAYIVLVDGQWTSVGGTSAVAPLYAGLIALLDQGLGRPVGLLLPQLYAAAASPGVFRNIVSGDNSVPSTPQFGPATAGYPAGEGWDACTGLGSLHGGALLNELKSSMA
jgi:kumamolisin